VDEIVDPVDLEAQKEPPCTPFPVSKFASAMNPKTPASSRASPASVQYHWAGVRA
jgi:hypothetical protein